MYDRAPRVLTATSPSNSTSSNIGPGVYEPEPREIKNGFAPFLSMSKRESFLAKQVPKAPGPGHYPLDTVNHDRIKGGTALQNRSTRFTPPPSSTPGPGAYSIASSLAKKTNPPPPSYLYLSENGGIVKGKNVLQSGCVFYSRQKTAPSIPFPGQSYGYEEDNNGQLQPQLLPDRDKTMGPAYYNVPHGETVTTKKYKGVHFSHLKSQRSQFKGCEGPGPGDYTYHPKVFQKGPSIVVPSSVALLPRYHELVPQLQEKKGVPGPGKYDLPSQFNNPGALVMDDAIEPPPFGCSQQRFVSSFPYSPASTKYEDPRTAFESLKRVSGLTKSPFGQTSARFRVSRKSDEIPGPGAYDNSEVTSMANELLKQAVVVGMKQSVFGTTSVRTVPLTKRDEKDIPGPDMYQETTPTNTSNKLNAVFASTSKRLYSPPPIVTSIPPPGSYEISKSHAKSQGRMESKRPTSNSAFLSSNSRFAPPRDISLNETDVLNPGPGMYEPDLNTRVGNTQHGLICSKDERFKFTQKSALGPGVYELSKSQRDTLLKGTHNVTLTNPLSTDEEVTCTRHVPPLNKKQTIILNV